MSEKKYNLDISNKISNFINKNDIVEPLNWVYPNKKEFVNWINETFIKYRANGKIHISSEKFKPFKYQKLLRDYMQNNSPYRGVLLYHGLGSGKTCSAITISENLKTERNIVVMIPASLKTNFIEDGLMFCGDTKYQEDPKLYQEKYTFITYNANNTLSQIKKIGSLDNKVIIIEEVHNLISKIVSGINGSSKQGLEIYNYLMNAQNSKIVALSGTPIINDPFELAILFNILRGFIEITYFRILKVSDIYGEEWNLDNLEKELMNNPVIDYLEINKINKSIEFHIKVKSYSEEYRELLENIEKICFNKGLIIKFLELKKYSLFSTENNGEIFRNYFVNQNFVEGNKLKNENIFKKRILGLVSYYRSLNDNYPTVIHNNYYRIEMSNYQYQIYEILRSKERLSEKGYSKDGKVKSTFRVFSRQASNFVFPEEINRPYPDPSFIVSILKKNNSELNKINKMLLLESNANNGKLTIDYKNRIQDSIAKLVENGNLYFKKGPNGLDKLSPKMNIILENIERSKGLIFVYSNFRTLEGIELFSKVLDFNGYSKYGMDNDNPKYSIYSGSEDEKEKKNILKIFTSYDNRYGKLLKIILATAAGAEGLNLKNLRQIHIMEPYWNQMRNQQVIGRGVRRNSHIALPKNEQNVEIFRYFSIFSKKNIASSKDKLTTDEHIEQLSLKKQIIINQLIEILKECSFDCLLNAKDIKENYDCFNFGANAKGFSYYPDISKDLIESYAFQEKVKVKKNMTRIIYYKKFVYLFYKNNKETIFYLYNDINKNPVDIEIKKAKPLLVDKNTNEVYNISDISSSNPIIIGVINKNNQIVKK